MSIDNSNRKAGPFSGDDASTEFAFSFKVFDDSDLYVARADSTGAETVLVLSTDYTVSINDDQDNSPGGIVTLASVLATGYTLTLSSSLDYLQPTVLTDQGGFYPSVLNDALDRLTIFTQQLNEQVTRAVKLPISNTTDTDALSAAVLSVANDLAHVSAVAADLTHVDTVANNLTDIGIVADNIADVTNFSDLYYGPSATDPTTRKDGSALQEGDLYFNTATNLMRVRTAVSGWLDAQTPIPVSITTQTFSGTGSQVDFTLSGAPAFLNAVEAAVSGVLLVPGVDYTLSGTTLSFTVAPASGTCNVFVRWYSAYLCGVPNDGSVTADKLAPGAVESVTDPRIGSAGSASCRNKINNPKFTINQRVVSGTVALAAGAFGHDRWKAGASGCTYTFSTTNGRTTLNITAGSLVQTIEGCDLPAGVNTMCLSWGGTCQGKIGAGSYGASGLTGSATGGTNISVEFGTGTLYKPQLEPGTVASEFDCLDFTQEEIRCLRYLEMSYDPGTVPGYSTINGTLVTNSPAISGGSANINVTFKVTKRAAPSITIYSSSGTSGMMRCESTLTDIAAAVNRVNTRSAVLQTTGSVTAGYQYAAHYTASCEI